VKFVLDTLQPLLIVDDKQVVHLSAMKVFAEPRCVLFVCPESISARV
jgi:Holliday junction resolvase RusA-like endonuclease